MSGAAAMRASGPHVAAQAAGAAAPALDATTARTYADALENHILPALGNYYYDTLLPTDVQRWIDDALLRGWTSEKRGSKRDKTKTVRRSYSRDTVKGWFRVFRTMTRDAMAALELHRDPTLRITMPEDTGDVGEANSLSPAQLAAFLTAMRTHYPQHYALVVLLAYTGLRFCHASALHWDDWDEAGGVCACGQTPGELAHRLVSRDERLVALYEGSCARCGRSLEYAFPLADEIVAAVIDAGSFCASRIAQFAASWTRPRRKSCSCS